MVIAVRIAPLSQRKMQDQHGHASTTPCPINILHPFDRICAMSKTMPVARLTGIGGMDKDRRTFILFPQSLNGSVRYVIVGAA
jgi:hypothetical protein